MRLMGVNADLKLYSGVQDSMAASGGIHRRRPCLHPRAEQMTDFGVGNLSGDDCAQARTSDLIGAGEISPSPSKTSPYLPVPRSSIMFESSCTQRRHPTRHRCE